MSASRISALAAFAALAISPLRAETGDDYLEGQTKAAKMINFLVAPTPAGESTRPNEAVAKEIASESPVRLKAKNGGELSLYLKAGCYSFARAGRSAECLRLWVNEAEPLRGAKVLKQEANQLIVGNTAGGLQVQVRFSISDAGALEVQPTIANTGSQAVPLRQLVTARGSYEKEFAAKDTPYYFREHYNIWGSNHPGHYELKEQTIHSFYFGVLFAPEKAKALTFAFAPNILWTSCVQADGKTRTLMAYTEFGKNPFNMTAGRKEAFDTLSIAFNDGLVDALLSYGRQFKPRLPIDHAKMAADAGWNSWEYFKPSISEKNLAPVLAEMSKREKETGLFPCFIVDAGYYSYYGKWAANPAKFPKGMNDYAEQIKKAGLRPGIWLSPAWVAPEVLAETGLPSFPHPNENEKKTRIFDPSDAKANAYFLSQVKDLASAGYTYFKTDFLHTAYRIDRDYGSSDYAPERVLREYYQKIRDVIGKDAYWLACGSVPIPTAGICDGSRIGPDVAANWERLHDSIQNQLMPRFWMHGNLWWADPDFLVVAGQGYTKEGQPIHGMKSKGTSKETGFTQAEARTWGNFIVVLGGMVNWSDNPSGISDDGYAVVKKTFEHGMGNRGIPLDYEKTTMPAKWVRREKDRIYVALFNWGDKPVKVAVSSKEIPELKEGVAGTDLMTGAAFTVKSGELQAALEPRASVCIEIKAAK